MNFSLRKVRLNVISGKNNAPLGQKKDGMTNKKRPRPRTIGRQPLVKRFSRFFGPIWRRQHRIILIHGRRLVSGCYIRLYTYTFISYMQELPPDLRVHFRSMKYDGRRLARPVDCIRESTFSGSHRLRIFNLAQKVWKKAKVVS